MHILCQPPDYCLPKFEPCIEKKELTPVICTAPQQTVMEGVSILQLKLQCKINQFITPLQVYAEMDSKDYTEMKDQSNIQDYTEMRGQPDFQDYTEMKRNSDIQDYIEMKDQSDLSSQPIYGNTHDMIMAIQSVFSNSKGYSAEQTKIEPDYLIPVESRQEMHAQLNKQNI